MLGLVIFLYVFFLKDSKLRSRIRTRSALQHSPKDFNHVIEYIQQYAKSKMIVHYIIPRFIHV